MPNREIQPYIYVFMGRLIDEHGLPTDVEFKNPRTNLRQPIAPGVFAQAGMQGRIKESGIFLGCRDRLIKAKSQETPQYIGRGMIRLNESPRIEDDTIVDCSLNVIENPDHRFGLVGNACFVWEDEGVALVEVEEESRSVNSKYHSFRVAYKDGRVSKDVLYFNRNLISAMHPLGPCIFSHVDDDNSEVYWFDTEQLTPIEHPRDLLTEKEREQLLSYEGCKHLLWKTKEFVAIGTFDHDSVDIYDRNGTLRSTFSGHKHLILSSSNRVAVFDRSSYPTAEDARIYTADGELIRRDPNLKLFKGRRSQSWFLSGGDSVVRKVFNSDFEYCYSLDPDLSGIILSTDGRAFCRGSTKGQPYGSGSFRCYESDGTLLRAYSYQTRRSAANLELAEQSRREEAEYRKQFRRTPHMYTYIENLYSANCPSDTGAFTYVRKQVGRGRGDYPGAIIILPYENGEPLCPACGLSASGYTFSEYDHDFYRCCRLQPDQDGNLYDDSKDLEFGGQFGVRRKKWLDKNNWPAESLARIEQVFQISTSDWPRD